MPWAWLWVPSISSTLLPCSILFRPRVWNPPLAPTQKKGLERDVYHSAKGLQTQVQPQVFCALFSHGGHATGPGRHWSCGQGGTWNSAQRDQRNFSNEALLYWKQSSRLFQLCHASKLRSQRTRSNASITKNPYFHPLCQKKGEITSSLYTEQRYDRVLTVKEQMRKDHKNVLSESNT